VFLKNIVTFFPDPLHLPTCGRVLVIRRRVTLAEEPLYDRVLQITGKTSSWKLGSRRGSVPSRLGVSGIVPELRWLGVTFESCHVMVAFSGVWSDVQTVDC